MLDVFLRQQGYSVALIAEYICGGIVKTELSTVKRMIAIENCIDYCQLLMVHDNVSYVALAKALFQKLNTTYIINLYDDIEMHY